MQVFFLLALSAVAAQKNGLTSVYTPSQAQFGNSLPVQQVATSVGVPYRASSSTSSQQAQTWPSTDQSTQQAQTRPSTLQSTQQAQTWPSTSAQSTSQVYTRLATPQSSQAQTWPSTTAQSTPQAQTWPSVQSTPQGQTWLQQAQTWPSTVQSLPAPTWPSTVSLTPQVPAWPSSVQVQAPITLPAQTSWLPPASIPGAYVAPQFISSPALPPVSTPIVTPVYTPINTPIPVPVTKPIAPATTPFFLPLTSAPTPFAISFPAPVFTPTPFVPSFPAPVWTPTPFVPNFPAPVFTPLTPVSAPSESVIYAPPSLYSVAKPIIHTLPPSPIPKISLSRAPTPKPGNSPVVISLSRAPTPKPGNSPVVISLSRAPTPKPGTYQWTVTTPSGTQTVVPSGGYTPAQPTSANSSSVYVNPATGTTVVVSTTPAVTTTTTYESVFVPDVLQTCSNRCGLKAHEENCYCDDTCVNEGDCCTSYFSICAGHNATYSLD